LAEYTTPRLLTSASADNEGHSLPETDLLIDFGGPLDLPPTTVSLAFLLNTLNLYPRIKSLQTPSQSKRPRTPEAPESESGLGAGSSRGPKRARVVPGSPIASERPLATVSPRLRRYGPSTLRIPTPTPSSPSSARGDRSSPSPPSIRMRSPSFHPESPTPSIRELSPPVRVTRSRTAKDNVKVVDKGKGKAPAKSDVLVVVAKKPNAPTARKAKGKGKGKGKERATDAGDTVEPEETRLESPAPAQGLGSGRRNLPRTVSFLFSTFS
jgi:hypothetical protein